MSNAASIQDDAILKKLVFIYNALEDGWSVTRDINENTYIFKKPHLNDKSITFDNYLTNFIHHNFSQNPFSTDNPNPLSFK
jgi:hypothetical protein